MRVLVYGAGVIGSLYGACLSRSGCEVAILARGHRLAELREKGLLYREGKERKKADVTVLDKLAPSDRYDYIFLTVRAEQLHTALKSLKANVSPTIVTMVNTLEDYSDWEDLCGKGRILPAFPGAGGSIRDGILDAALTPRIIQPTTFGEVDGSRSKRMEKLKEILTKAGVPCQIVPDMHAWQICHLAMVVPLADAYYMVEDPKLVHKDKTVMRKTAQALHDNFSRLKHRGDAISPPKLNLFRLCPVSLIAAILPFVYNSSFGNRFMYQHAVKAKEEMGQLHQVFYSYLNDNIEVNKYMKADYKNWVPNGMIKGFGTAALGLAAAAVGAGLLGRNTASTIASAVLGAGALGCGAFTAWCVYANGQFSYNGERKLSKQIVEGTAEYVILPEGGVGLDVGCGSGALTIACAKRNPQGIMVGIDRWGKEYASFNQPLCERNAQAEGVTNTKFRKGDATKLDFPDESFDVVTSNYVYHNITGKDKQALLRETLRVLKKGGTFAIHDLMSPMRYGDMENFVQQLKAEGYEEVRLIDTTRGMFMSPSEAKMLTLGSSTLLVGRK